jgi:hypothetical protein
VSIGACETPPIDSLLGEFGTSILINLFCQKVAQFSKKFDKGYTPARNHSISKLKSQLLKLPFWA